MSKVQLREGYGPRDVPLLNRVVEEGEVFDLPDFQEDGISPRVHPDPPFQPVDDKPAKTGKADA